MNTRGREKNYISPKTSNSRSSELNPHDPIIEIHGQVDRPLDLHHVEAAVRQTLAEEQAEASSIRIILLSDDELRRMKNTYFRVDQYTDVIAFNLNAATEILEGELYLAPGQILANAKEYGEPAQKEFLRVVVHGTLHLCGHEDDTPSRKETMHGREDLVLQHLQEKEDHPVWS